MQVLICDALSFMRPYLQKVELTDSIRTLYKGLLCILLVLLHDFPSFLCQYHFAFCDLIPTTCVQMRNLVLSAFPRTMRLPDPFTPNLKVSELPEISIAPRILSDYVTILDRHELRQKVEKYLKTGKPTNFVRYRMQTMSYFFFDIFSIKFYILILLTYILKIFVLFCWIY